MYDVTVRTWTTRHDRDNVSHVQSRAKLDQHSIILSAGGICWLIYILSCNGDKLRFGNILTISLIFVDFGLLLVALTMSFQESAEGLSISTIRLQISRHLFRLCSTTWFRGYIPIGHSGEDYTYPSLDWIALLALFYIRYRMETDNSSSCQTCLDKWPVNLMRLGCFVLAACFHPDMNDRVVFDVLWMTGEFLECITLVPQVFLMGDRRWKIQSTSLSGYYLLCLAMSRCLDVIFWYVAIDNMQAVNGSITLVGWVILAIHVVKLVVMYDVLYQYINVFHAFHFSNSWESLISTRHRRNDG